MNDKRTRRTFLGLTTKVLGGAVAFAAGANFNSSFGKTATPQAPLSYDTFAPLVNSAFSLQSSGSQTSRLVLDRVESQLSKAHSAGRQVQSFSLLFRQNGNEFFAQDTYRFHHRAIGSFEMFIVPVSPGGKGQYYEAIFSRLV